MTAGTIELTGAKDFAPCKCCGLPIRRVWGNLIDDFGKTPYVVQWSVGAGTTHAVMIGLIFGPWEADSGPDHRAHVAVECRRATGAMDKVDIMVVDASRSPIETQALASKLMQRHEVINKPLHQRVFDYVEQIRARDIRVNGLMPQ